MEPSTKKMAFPIFLAVLMVISLVFTPMSMATSQATQTLSSSGVIFYLSSVQKSQTSLPYSCLGEDYLVYYENGSPELWLSSGILDKMAKWGCNGVRLGFAFSDCAPRTDGLTCHSIYLEWKMDRVVEILWSQGIKSILDLHNGGDMYGYLGSTEWVNNWKDVASHYKGDQRIAGFQIFNEPNTATWASSGPVGPINTKADVAKACAYLIDEIRSIDPSRTIFYPVFQGMGMGYAELGFSNDSPSPGIMEWYNDLTTYDIPFKGNIIYDIIHPYYAEDQWDLGSGYTPEHQASWFESVYIRPLIDLLGVENCWCGETFASPDKTWSYQMDFETRMINIFVRNQIGFQIWAYVCRQEMNDEALSASDYPSTIRL